MSDKELNRQGIFRENKTAKYLKYAFIVVMDMALAFVCNLAVCYFTEGKTVGDFYTPVLFSYIHLIILCAASLIFNTIFGLYISVWRFAGIDEIIRGSASAFLQTVFLFFTDRVIFRTWLNKLFPDKGFRGGLAWYAYVMFFVLLAVAIIAPRLAFRIIKKYPLPHIAKRNKSHRVMLVGAGFMGNFVIDALRVNDYRDGVPIIAVDDNPQKKGKKINGVKVVGSCDDIPRLVEKHKIDTIILCVPSATKTRQREILNIAIPTGAKIKISPSVDEMFDKTADKRVRNVEITDLLARPEVTLDRKVCKYLIGKTILVTGGGGSIGSEICMQVAKYNPKAVIIFDIYENCAFELQNELKYRYGDEFGIYVRIGSVRDTQRLREIFEEFHPDVVFHAAAHKHVPLMEDSPCEAVKNNVFGTYNVAVIADEYKVDRMVILSTDKAVNPTNVMGCTKRITEIIVQYMNEKSENTKYAAVRFGNVLGSHGSVIPIFKKEIEKGGPITVTDPNMTRYFMTIPEAAQLVCQAGGLARGGEVFVLDMGEPVKIMDLAENLIRLSGFTTEEIGIKIIGLRPGEKLYEELSMESEMETREKTQNEKIFVNQPMKIDPERFDEMLSELSDINADNVRKILKKYVPNYHPSDRETNNRPEETKSC